MVTKNIIEAKFKRSGIRSKSTYLWDNMPDELKSQVLDKVELSEGESCVLCFFESPSYILLFTTDRIVIMSINSCRDLSFSEINDVRVNDVFDGKQSKEENNTLDLTLKSEEVIRIKVEEGTWPVLYSIIKFVSL